MSKRVKFTPDEKYQLITEVLNGEASIHSVAKTNGIAFSTVDQWIHNYSIHGMDGLKEASTWKRYSDELKLQAVQSVMNGDMSIRQATKEFAISSHTVLRDWILRYTSGQALKSTSKGRVPKEMNKGRKTTFQERLEITQFTLANDLDYAKAIEKYGVSYQQIYSWVRKYKTQGESGLKDNRGRNRSNEELTEQERLKLRIKELEVRNQFLEMERDFAKKLQDIRRKKRD